MRHKVALLGGFALIAAGSLASSMFFIFMPNNLIARHGVSLSPTLLVTAAALAAAGAAALLAQVLIGMAVRGVLSFAMFR